MKKDILVQFDREAYREYQSLQNLVLQRKSSRKKPTYAQLLSSINTAVANLKIDPHYGNLIPRKYLSKRTMQRYGTDKIFRVELVGYWRLLYTLVGDEAKIIAFVLEYMDHAQYNKIFGYKKK